MIDWHWARGALAQFTLFLLITGMAGTIDVPSFRRQLMNCRGVGIGLFCQFVLLPFVGFCSVKIFNLEFLDGVMLLLTVASPGGGFSGFWCSVWNADVALSIAMTTVSTIMSIVLLPLNMFMYLGLAYDTYPKINFMSLFLSIGIVISAVISGLVVSTLFPSRGTLVNRIGSVAGLVNIMLALSPSGKSVTDGERMHAPPVTPSWVFAVCFPCVVGILTSFTLARALRVTNPEAVSICIECCYQNTGLAITVALTVFSPAESRLAKRVPLFYGIVEVSTIIFFGAVAWKRGWTYTPFNATLKQCIGGNFQPMGPSQEAEQQIESELLEMTT